MSDLCLMPALFGDNTLALATWVESFGIHWTGIVKHSLCSNTLWQPCGRYKNKAQMEPAPQS